MLLPTEKCRDRNKIGNLGWKEGAYSSGAQSEEKKTQEKEK